MCGIFGFYYYTTPKTLDENLTCLLTGLSRLSYRGYDSAGICLDYNEPSCLPKQQSGTTTTTDFFNNNNTAASTKPKTATPTSLSSSSPPALVIKCSGKITDLELEAHHQLTNNNTTTPPTTNTGTGIAHTRWATHGPPTFTNAHPHVSSPLHEFVVVHNGIVTNYKALKAFLERNGDVFESDTDTEVIPKLLNYIYNSRLASTSNGSGDNLNGKSVTESVSSSVLCTFAELVVELMQQLEGAYALLIKSVRHSSIDIDGGGEGGVECFVASDASAIVELTKQVIVLEDGDLVSFNNGHYNIYNISQPPPCPSSSSSSSFSSTTTHGAQDRTTAPFPLPAAAERALQTLQMEVAQIMKGGYDHYMQKEIFEQPESLSTTMSGRFKGPSPTNPTQRCFIKLGGLTDSLRTILTGRRIVFVGCGTSYHACLATRSTMEQLVGLSVSLELASDMLDRQCPIFRDDTCVFVSQSGETADTLHALEYCKARGALCIGITNTVGSAIARATHCGVHINAGCEIGVASTKACTSQIVITMMALALSADSFAKQAKHDEIVRSLLTLPDAVRETLHSLDAEMRELAEMLKGESSLLVFGRGYNCASALEAALKVKEVALMHSEGILAGEMKHGPLALVDESLPIIVIATRDNVCSKMLNVIEQLRARSATLIVLCCTGDEEVGSCCMGGNYGIDIGTVTKTTTDSEGTTASTTSTTSKRCVLIKVPQVADCLQPVVNIVPLQLLSYHLTVLRGYDVDQPRNLAKSVTVTEG